MTPDTPRPELAETRCRSLIKRIDDLLHDKDSETAHVELHELAHEFELLMPRLAKTPGRNAAAKRIADDLTVIISAAEKNGTLPRLKSVAIYFDEIELRTIIAALAPGNAGAVEANIREALDWLINCVECEVNVKGTTSVFQLRLAKAKAALAAPASNPQEGVPVSRAHRAGGEK